MGILMLLKSCYFSFMYGGGPFSTHLLAQWETLFNWIGLILLSGLPSLVAQALDKDDDMFCFWSF